MRYAHYDKFFKQMPMGDEMLKTVYYHKAGHIVDRAAGQARRAAQSAQEVRDAAQERGRGAITPGTRRSGCWLVGHVDGRIQFVVDAAAPVWRHELPTGVIPVSPRGSPRPPPWEVPEELGEPR